MKTFFALISIALCIVSCKQGKEQGQHLQMVNPNSIRVGEVAPDSLSTEQIEKIKRIQSTFAEVYPISLRETIDNFTRDADMDNEITIWLQMADAYEQYLESKKGKLSYELKSEAFRLILSRSMMGEDEAIESAKINVLSENEAREVLSYYTASPDPIDVLEKP